MLWIGLMTSCIKENKPVKLTQKEIQQKIDSIVSKRTLELEEQGRKDLKLRTRIEVKVKADSILKAREVTSVRDSLMKANIVAPAQPQPGLSQRVNIKIPPAQLKEIRAKEGKK